MADSTSNPHIRDTYSPLETLAFNALRRYGDFTPGSVDGDVMLMFIGFANEIINEIRQHPYWDGTPINYYKSQTDAREIPDNIIETGLLAKYAEQQFSEKYQIYSPKYARTMNQLLWERLNGNTKISLRVHDKTPTNETNGQPK